MVKNSISTHPVQSPEWAEFRSIWGNEVTNTPYGFMTIHKIPFTAFKIGAFVRGPEPTQDMVNWLKRFGKENNLIFIKLEPNIKKTDILVAKLKKWGATPGRKLFNSETFWIDLTKGEDELMKSFSQKTRYNIRLAERRGVTISEDNSEKGFANYWRLHEETTKRQGFHSHTKKYHELLWKILRLDPLSKNKKPLATILHAIYNSEVITSWLLFTYKDFLYYVYGGSTDRYKNVMANNLMMWEAIKFGKKNGLKFFDLWGRDEGKGFTRFKEGYNPQVVEFIGTWDLVINRPIYIFYSLLDELRWFVLKIKAKLKGH